MSVKFVLALCAQALFVQATFSHCLGAPFGWAGTGLATAYGYDRFPGPFSYDRFASPLGYDGLASWAGRGLGCNAAYGPALEIAPTSSGGLIVTSSSPVAPTGISVISDNAYEGILAVAGEVPFIGTTGMEGIVPTIGVAAVSHACGNGNNAMVSDIGYGGFGPGEISYGGFGFGAIVPGIVPTIASGYTGCGCGYLY